MGPDSDPDPDPESEQEQDPEPSTRLYINGISINSIGY